MRFLQFNHKWSMFNTGVKHIGFVHFQTLSTGNQKNTVSWTSFKG